jgi:hypothetical protein
VKLIIVHYHLRPGGIRRVIELAAPFLQQRLGDVPTVELACGEAADEKWNQSFARLVAPAKLNLTVTPALGYFSEQKKSPAKIRAELKCTLAKLLADPDCLVWAHNLGIGRNLLLTRELTRACAARGITADLPSSRLVVRQSLAALAGNPSLRFSARSPRSRKPFSRRPHPPRRHQSRRGRHPARHSAQTSAWLPNLATRQKPQNRRAFAPPANGCNNARHEIRARLDSAVSLVAPKNVAEALLLTRWLRPEAWLVTTGGASSADERPILRN